MTPDGQFRTPYRSPFTTQIFAGAVLVAVVAGGLALAAFALWIALLLVPVAIVAIAFAVLVLRFKLWQARRNAAGYGGSGFMARRP